MPPGPIEALTSVTDEDRQAAAALLDEALTGGYSHDGANEFVARALVAERVKARAPFRDLADAIADEAVDAIWHRDVLKQTAARIRRAAEEQP